jgi:NADP-dependent 3-hydroxy acid dehydrogenase YdfG
MKKNWLITGCSTGFGRALALEALAQGHQVAVASRNTKDVLDIIEKYPDLAIAVTLDVTNKQQITDSVKLTIEKFGRIDVLVNNAGVGYFGAVEESEDDAVKNMFDINVFGLGNMIQEVLPFMRKQKSGHILNVASIGGLRSFPGVGYYNATELAAELERVIRAIDTRLQGTTIIYQTTLKRFITSTNVFQYFCDLEPYRENSNNIGNNFLWLFGANISSNYRIGVSNTITPQPPNLYGATTVYVCSRKLATTKSILELMDGAPGNVSSTIANEIMSIG